MADAYGTIIVCGDYEGDLDAIAELLNSFRLNESDVQFSVYVDTDIVLDNVVVQYPTVFLSREIADEDGDLESESYSLEELSGVISPLLTKGTIELIAVANEKNRYAYYDRLRVMRGSW
jgi:hypothetical protein